MTNYEGMVETFRKFSPALKTMGEMYNTPTEAIEKISKIVQQISGVSNALDMFQMPKSFLEQMERIQGTDFSKIRGVQEQIQGMQAIMNYMGIENSLYNSAIPNITKALEDYYATIDFDCSGMMNALQNILARQNKMEEQEAKQNTEEEDDFFDKIAEEIQEEYEKTYPNKVDSSKSKYDIGKEIREWLGIVIGIIQIIISMHSNVNTSSNIIYNNSIEVNNYYVNELEIDADYLNLFHYGIVNQNHICPRMKPGYKARVTGELMEGQVVQKTDKKKKWVQISWENENGDICYGWIQNYKIDKFKKCQIRKK